MQLVLKDHLLISVENISYSQRCFIEIFDREVGHFAKSRAEPIYNPERQRKKQ